MRVPVDLNRCQAYAQCCFLGSGVHSCFGAPLSRLEAQIALRLFFERVVNSRLVGEPRYRPSPLLRRPNELTVAYDGVCEHIDCNLHER